ncbi:MAG TPA: hypothetical protein VLX61_13320 [Anaerolineales bacterium]|nr:hypothetical protein [Anaerolineales bacterium]
MSNDYSVPVELVIIWLMIYFLPGTPGIIRFLRFGKDDTNKFIGLLVLSSPSCFIFHPKLWLECWWQPSAPAIDDLETHHPQTVQSNRQSRINP